jgi:predicted O-methyltransferase YrrM
MGEAKVTGIGSMIQPAAGGAGMDIKTKILYSKFQLAIKYFKHQLHASNSKGHGIHSPFIFYLVDLVLNDHQRYATYRKIEAIRKKLLKDKSILELEDYGAGSAVLKTNTRSVSSIVKSVVKKKKYGQLLFRIVYNLKPEYILELGTSFGLSTAYMSMANPASNVITCEGSPVIADIALQNFKNAGLKNIELVKGNFDDTLSGIVNRLPKLDLVFFDGNHRKEPTLNYFQTCLPKAGEKSVFIFDDIHWSEDMESAWKMIQSDPAVYCTVDLFFMGLVFFRPEFREKQHFVIRF